VARPVPAPPRAASRPRRLTPVRTEWVTLDVADGSRMRAFVARPPAGERRPGLLLFQEAFGVNPHIRDVATRFARAGYTTIAPELFHRTAPPGFEGAYGDFPSIERHFHGVTVDGLEADTAAAHKWLTADPEVDHDRVAAVGFCMGGRVSYVAATFLPLRAAVSFYGARIAPALLDRAPNAQGRLLFFWGGQDQSIPTEQQRAVVDALRAAGKTYVTVEFGAAGHAFFCDARPNYHPTAAAEAWALTLAFLKDALD